MSELLVDLGAVPAGVQAVVAVPAQEPAPPPGKGPEFGKSSPVALVVILLLGLTMVLLIRNMSKRIRRLPANFDDSAESGRAADAAPDAGAAPKADVTAEVTAGAEPDGDRKP